MDDTAVAEANTGSKVFVTSNVKFVDAMEDLKMTVNMQAHEKGQPVLVGTITIETSELLSGMLKREGIPHTVLNAKLCHTSYMHHARSFAVELNIASGVYSSVLLLRG